MRGAYSLRDTIQDRAMMFFTIGFTVGVLAGVIAGALVTMHGMKKKEPEPPIYVGMGSYMRIKQKPKLTIVKK